MTGEVIVVIMDSIPVDSSIPCDRVSPKIENLVLAGKIDDFCIGLCWALTCSRHVCFSFVP